MEKLLLSDIKSGSLVSEIREKTVEFWHNCKKFSVDIRIKQLPFIETESLLLRRNNKEDVVAEWISKALVDDQGNLYLTKEDVELKFVQGLALAVYDEVWGLENVKKAMEKPTTKTKKA